MEGSPSWLRRLRRFTYAVSTGVIALCAVFAVVIGAVEVHDRNLPRHWGTFTETSTACHEFRPNNCSSTGTWVSDDGKIVKDEIQLDGNVEPGRSVRAVYRAGGAAGHDDIVHTERWANAGLWVPFLCAIGLMALAWQTGRKAWRA